MSAEKSTLEVFILDKSYRINCPENEQESLRSASQYLDRKMREIRGGSKVIGLERIAVIAALNIAHELLSATQQANAQAVSGEEVTRLIEKVEKVLAQHQG
jgi:cell division protein ZapA